MNRRYILSFLLMLFLLFILALVNLGTGSAGINPVRVLMALSGNKDDMTVYKIIWSIRFPRIIAAVLLGGALSVSGFLLQTFFANPIAGPYILGISSGAKLTVALSLIFFLSHGIDIGSSGMVLAAFAGSLLAMLIVLVLSFRVNNMSKLIVCGILIGYICSAVTDFCVTFADDSNIVNLHNWAAGSFSGTSWSDVRVMSVIVIFCICLSFLMSKSIGAFLLGENYARSLGVNITVLRIALIILSSLLSGCVTAFAGPVSFVGLAVPHLVRSLTGTAKPIILIPGCFIGGAVITVFCDGIARTLFAPLEVNISSVTAVMLVPVVIWMIVKRQGAK